MRAIVPRYAHVLTVIDHENAAHVVDGRHVRNHLSLARLEMAHLHFAKYRHKDGDRFVRGPRGAEPRLSHVIEPHQQIAARRALSVTQRRSNVEQTRAQHGRVHNYVPTQR